MRRCWHFGVFASQKGEFDSRFLGQVFETKINKGLIIVNREIGFQLLFVIKLKTLKLHKPLHILKIIFNSYKKFSVKALSIIKNDINTLKLTFFLAYDHVNK